VSTSVLLPTVYVEIVNAAVAASVGFPECHATAGRRSRREHNTKAGVASCIVVYHNCATSIASLRIQSPLSLESLRSGIDRRNDAMISLTQCMILGGLGPNETILRQTSFAAFKLSVQFKARACFRTRYDYCRSAFYYRRRALAVK
jgi:hypothetical protein